jgi:multiple sugar transport system substrate-binding protein
MRRQLDRALSAVVALALGAALLAGCSAGGPEVRTLTYWASNQGTTVANDYEVLRPELEKFRQQTGITVNVQVISWSDLLNRLLSATVTGTGPDVINIGNTWAVSLQATGGLLPFDATNAQAIGGLDKFLDASLKTTGAPGQTPTSVPLYGLAYGLFYNKKLFAAAGLAPPKNWTEFDAAAKKLTDPAANRWGVVLAGSSYTEGAHFAFILGQQHGGDFFDPAGAPQFTQQALVDGIKQYVDLIGTQKVASPSSAQYATTQEATAEFTAGRAAMIMSQNNTAATLKANGMSPDDFGVVPMPLPAPLPPGGRAINSHAAGINIAAMVDGHDHAGSLALIKFLTSPEEQQILNSKFGSLPVLKEPVAVPDPSISLFRDILATTAAPMPLITNESEFETTVGTAVRELLARAATGGQVDEQAVRDALAGAETSLRGSTS